MNKFVTVKIGYAELDPISKLPVFQTINPIDGDNDFENFGQIVSYGPIGFTSLPYPVDDSGYCEGLGIRDVAGLNGIVISARDERNSSIYGNMQFGDTCVHASGPGAEAQLLLKKEKNICALLSKSNDGKNIGLSIDPDQEEITIFGYGCAIKLSKADGIVLAVGTFSISLDTAGKFCANAASGSLGSVPAQLGIVYSTTPPPVPFVGVPSTTWTISV